MKSETKTDKKAEVSFEAALERLEEIAAEMESGELPLAESMKRFEEGTKLANFCTKKLGETEKKIEVLMNKNKKSEPEWTPFGGEKEAEDEEGGDSSNQGELGI